MARRWILAPHDPDLSRHIAQSLGVHPIVANLLIGRGIPSAEVGRTFLDRRLTNLHDPEQLPGASQAADRIFEAVQQGKNICIYGDYDVDGMCATSILLECLKLGGAKPRFHVPDRMEEGYGVNGQALQRLRDEGIDLVITVDCGVNSHREAELAESIGLEYIITDHHELPDVLPQAAAIVHPRLPGTDYPCGELCGAGVAFKLAWELARRFSGERRTSPKFQQYLLDATSLAAIGTICDLVPLIDENRVLVHHGLRSLKRLPPVGLQCLMEVSKLTDKQQLTTQDVGFTLGPRLNACGRLGTARLGVELLTTRDRQRGLELARYLELENKNRQTLERRIFTEAKTMAKERYRIGEDGQCAAIVLANEEWHQGVIGIVASRMVEKFHVPCVLISLNEGVGTGSARSIDGFHLQQALLQCSDSLVKSGGHAMAAGLKINADLVDQFAEAFHEKVVQSVQKEALKGVLRVDAEVPLHSLTPSLLNALEVLEPFGRSNPSPLLMASGLQIVGEPKGVGGGERHLSFRVQQGGCTKKAIAFNQADRADELMSDGGRCCLAFTPSINEYNGYRSVDLLVKDFRPGARVTDEVPAVCQSP